MWLYQMLKEQAPGACGLMLYLIELAETDKHCFNSVSWALRENRIPLDMKAVKLHVKAYRGRKNIERETREAYKGPGHRLHVAQLTKQQKAQEAELQQLIKCIDQYEQEASNNQNNTYIHPGRSTDRAELGADHL